MYKYFFVFMYVLVIIVLINKNGYNVKCWKGKLKKKVNVCLIFYIEKKNEKKFEVLYRYCVCM